MRRSHVALSAAIGLAGVLLGLVAVNAMGSAAPTPPPPSPASAAETDRLNAALASQGGVGDAQWLDCGLSETLPNFRISWDGGPEERIFAATIDGRVREVRPGSSQRDSVGDDGAIARDEVAFDDPSATWRTVVLRVEVSNDFDPHAELPTEIDVVLWLDGATDPDVILDGFRGQRVFAVVEEPRRLEPSTAYPVARNGALIGVVAEDGSVSLPGLEESEGAYLDGLDSISEIEAASRVPAIVLPLSTAKGYWERTDCA